MKSLTHGVAGVWVFYQDWQAGPFGVVQSLARCCVACFRCYSDVNHIM